MPVRVAPSRASATTSLPGNDADSALLPRHYGLLAWSMPVGQAQSNAAVGAGVLTLSKIYVPRTMSITNVVTYVSTAGSVVANAFAGIYDSTGATLGGTADQSTPWQSAGFKSIAITGGPISVTGGEDVFVWGALLVGSATGVPAFLRQNWQAVGVGNLGVTAANSFGGGSGSAQTALPPSFTPSAINGAQYGGQYWVALS